MTDKTQEVLDLYKDSVIKWFPIYGEYRFCNETSCCIRLLRVEKCTITPRGNLEYEMRFHRLAVLQHKIPVLPHDEGLYKLLITHDEIDYDNSEVQRIIKRLEFLNKL